MKRQPVSVQKRLAQCYFGDVAISSIMLAELEFGVAASGEAKAQNQAALEALLEEILVAPFEARAARAHGPLRAANRQGNQDALDKLIAAHALALGATLVTNNEADFRGFSGLRVENWVAGAE